MILTISFVVFKWLPDQFNAEYITISVVQARLIERSTNELEEINEQDKPEYLVDYFLHFEDQNQRNIILKVEESVYRFVPEMVWGELSYCEDKFFRFDSEGLTIEGKEWPLQCSKGLVIRIVIRKVSLI